MTLVFFYQSSGAKDSVDNDIMMCVQAISTFDKYVSLFHFFFQTVHLRENPN